MIKQLGLWLRKRAANAEMMMLFFSLIILVILFWLMGKLLLPVLVSVILAYLLDGIVKQLVLWKMPHTLAVSIVCLVCIGLFLLALFVLLPLVWEQLSNLFNELPSLIKRLETTFTHLSTQYPDYISKKQIQGLLSAFQQDFANTGKVALSYSLATLSSVMQLIVYLVLVPLMVFFFLKDRDDILNWFSEFLPKKRRLIREVWSEVNLQIGNYIRAKILEVVIVGVVSWIVFAILGLNYSILLAVLVGLSALIPYVGVVIVTIPVLIVGYMQWGFSPQFVYLLIAFMVIMAADGNVLAPLLFSETLKIHPVAVIAAVLIFGGLWGFWGIFFAIPLASVVKALLNVWLANEREIVVDNKDRA